MTPTLEQVIEALREELQHYGEMLALLEAQHGCLIRQDAQSTLNSCASLDAQRNVLETARATLTRQYGRPFDSIGFNLYRDCRDSVAWHADRERYYQEDPVVAIVSTGQPRPFHVRPRGGGTSMSWHLGHGDLFVMGGSCQHDWDHCVPKVTAAGPRLSIMFRHNLAE